ncbi:MAG: hypothetical protein AAF196_06700 [Planctomycetota bacterium]
MSRFFLFALLALVAPSCDEVSKATGDGDDNSNTSNESDTSGVASKLGELGGVLEGVTNTETANAAKDKIGTLVQAIEQGMGSLGGLAGGAGEGVGSLLGSALPAELKDPIGAVQKQIGRLLGNADTSNVLGDLLQRLKGVLPEV